MTTLIKNGTIVTATEMYKADILVKNGVISEIGREISKIASEIVDAAEKWVLPGAVDVHTHIDAQCDGMTTVDDFETGTAAAAAGGTTTVVDYAEQEPGVSLAQTLEKWKTKAGPRAVIDYGFHLALSEINDSILSEIPAMVDAGVTSFKISLDGAGERYISDADVLEFLQKVGGAGGLACVHAENGQIINLLLRRLGNDGKAPVKSVLSIRPPEIEAESTARVITLAELAKVPLYIANLSSAHADRKGENRSRPRAGGFCRDLSSLPCTRKRPLRRSRGHQVLQHSAFASCLASGGAVESARIRRSSRSIQRPYGVQFRRTEGCGTRQLLPRSPRASGNPGASGRNLLGWGPRR